MAGGRNQTNLIIAGDSSLLDKAAARAVEDANRMAKSFDKAADQAVASSKRMEHVAEASDHIDTLGSKATSSLGALSSGFELLGGSSSGAAQGLMTAALATDALSGAGEAATIATSTLKEAVDKAKAAFGGLSTASKVTAISLGAIGVAAVAAGAVFLVLKARQDEIKKSAEAYADTLENITHATTNATRVQIYKNLADKDLIKTSRSLGLSTSDVINAVLGEKEALDKVNAAIDAHSKAAIGDQFASGGLSAKAKELRQNISDQTQAIKEAQDATVNLSEVNGTLATRIRAAATATRDATQAYKDQNKAIRDQLDPLTNAYHRAQDVTEAQKAWNDALKKYGPKSEAARDAAVKLAEAQADAKDALAGISSEIQVHGAVDLQTLADKLGLNKVQAKALADALGLVYANGKKLNGQNFQFSVTQKNKVIGANSSAPRNRFDLEGNPTNRRASGGMTSGLTLVGENGPEILATGSSAYVANARETMSLLSGAGAARPQTVTVVLDVRQDEGIIVTAVNKNVTNGRINTVVRA